MAWKPSANADYLPTEEELLKAFKKGQGMKRFVDQLIPPLDDHLSPTDLGKKYEETFGSIRCVLIDLSGTLYVGNETTEFAVESLEQLRKLGLKIRFVTNTLTEPKRVILERLQDLGFTVKENEIFTSLSACQKLIERKKYQPYYLVPGSAMEDFPNRYARGHNAVIVGLTPMQTIDMLPLNKALELLLHGAALIGVHNDNYYESGDGISLGPGPLIQSLELTAKTKAVFAGKPEASFYIAAVESTGCTVNETVMIGDEVTNDVLGAIQAGLKGILVQTGKYSGDDEKLIAPVTPDYVGRNFAYAVRCIEAAICTKAKTPLGLIEIKLNDKRSNEKIKNSKCRSKSRPKSRKNCSNPQQ